MVTLWIKFENVFDKNFPANLAQDSYGVFNRYQQE